MKKKLIVFLVTFSIISAQENSDKFSQAQNAYQNFNFGLALKLFKEISEEGIIEQQKLSSAKYFAGECLLNLDQLDGAAIEFEQLINNYPYSNFRSAALYKLGTTYYLKQEYRKARARLSTLLKEYPSSEYNGSAYYWIAEAYFAENKYAEAEENFRTAIKNKSSNRFIPYSFFSLAQLYEKIENYKSATTLYDELLTYYKESSLAPLSQLRIGICYFNLNDYDNAILELTDPLIQKLALDELIQAKFFLANSFVRLKEYSEAEKIYKELLNDVSDNSFKNRISYSLAWLNFQTGKYEDAFETFQELSKAKDDTLNIASFFWSGESKRYLGDSKTSDAIFKEFVQKYPEHQLAYKAQLGSGAVHLTQNNTPNAESALLNAALAEDKSIRGRAFTLLGELRLNDKKFDAAKKYFNDAVKITTAIPELYNRALFGLAVAQFYLNDYNNAEMNFESLQLRAKDFETDKVNFYLAETYLTLGKYSAALKNYNRIRSSNEQINKQTLLGRAYSHFNLNDFPNSIYYFNEFINKYRNDPNVNEAKLRLADSYFGSKNFEKASVIYLELFTRDKLNDDIAFYQYGQSLFKAGKAVEAIQASEELQQRFPRSKYLDESQYLIGWIHFQQNDFSGAIDNYKKLIVKYPRSNLKPIAYYSIGDSYFNLGLYDSSIVFYSKVLEEFPNTPYIFDAVNGIQYAYVAKEQPENAVSFVDNYVAANPSSKYSDQIYFKKGDLYYSLENYDSAIKAYRDFISRFPNSMLIANAYFWIGKSAANLKNDTEAVNSFSTAKQIAIKKDIGISAAIELAKIYSDKKQFDNAIKSLDDAIDANPTSNRVSELLFLKGVNESKANKIDNAASTFDQTISYYEGTIFAVKAKVELGIIELQRNNFEKAQALLKEVGESRLDDIGAQAQYYCGVSLFNQNKISDAITSFVRVRSVFAVYDEWYTKSLLRLGDCFIKLNDKKQAREMFRAVLIRHSSGEYAQEAKRKINQL